jgi:protoheme IX farnesyltransferase
MPQTTETANLDAVIDAPSRAPSRARSRAGERAESRARALIETTKPGITRLVTITSGVGFAMAGVGRNWTQWELLTSAFGCLLGTALSAAGANALNQWMERDRDARMPRTADRPIPRGSLTPRDVLMTGAALGVSGVLVLWLRWRRS